MSTLIQVATNWLSRKANLLSCDIYVGDNVKFILEITRTKISQMMKEPNSLTLIKSEKDRFYCTEHFFLSFFYCDFFSSLNAS